MKKLLTLVIAGGMLSFIACGPSKAELEAKEKARQDSIRVADSVAAATAAAEAKAKADADSIAAAEAAAKAKADSIAAAEAAAAKAPKKAAKPNPKTVKPGQGRG